LANRRAPISIRDGDSPAGEPRRGRSRADTTRHASGGAAAQQCHFKNKDTRMNVHEAIKMAINGSDMLCQSYLEDLTDEEMMVRPVEKCNHIAWQVGHLIQAENGLISAVCPGSMPPLPDGFAERYSKEAATVDNPSRFLKKSELLKLHKQQRAATLQALDTLSAADFDKPAPESVRDFCPTVGAVFNLQGTHWLMHAGQWAVVRRKLGRPPLM
jgi:hypothetical protein